MELDLDKLTEIASGEKSLEDSSEKKKTHPHILQFIEDCEVRTGKNYVPFYKIYNEYTNWFSRKKLGKVKDRMSHIQFGKEFGPKFEQRTIGRIGRCYMLNNCFKMDNLEKDKRTYEQKIKQNKVQKEKNKT